MPPGTPPDIDRQIVRQLAPAIRILGWSGALLGVALVMPGWLLSWAGLTDALRLPDVPSAGLLFWLVPISVWLGRTTDARTTRGRLRIGALLIATTPGVIGALHLLLEPGMLAVMLVDLPLALSVAAAGLSVALLDARLTAAVGIWGAVQFGVLSLLAAPYYGELDGQSLLHGMLAGPGAIVRRAGVVLAIGLLAAALAHIFRRGMLALFAEQAARADAVQRQILAEQARARAAAESAAKTRFLGALSHEIRTPLHALTAHARRLGDAQGLADGHRRSARVVIDSSHHLLDILEATLDTTREDAGHVMRAEAFGLRALFDEVVALFSARAADGGIALSGAVADDVPDTVRGVRRRWRQVLVNLVSNGLKYTAAGEVALRADEDGGRLVLTVRDTGVGLTADQAATAFDDFTRVGDGAAAGHGLGLAITRQLVGRMDGTITLDSAPGRGTLARVELPLPAPRQPSSVAPTALPAPPPSARETLRELALRGDLGGIGRLLDAPPFTDPTLEPFVSRARALADAFDDGGLLALIDDIPPHAQGAEA